MTVIYMTGYDIVIGRGALNDLCDRVCKLDATRVMIVTDTNVQNFYLKKVVDLLKGRLEVRTFALPAGEENKNIDVCAALVEQLARLNFTRGDAVIALGGGIVGDVAGFAAATYMRGIRIAQIPTSLVAMIDSSIGGKTGVNLEAGKNLMGAFHNPSFVIIDPDLLLTLPYDEWRNGLGEGIKYACLSGGEIYDILKTGLNEENLERFIVLCASYKADIVSRDERESGLRKLLNLGHTLGHAIERESGYAISHGIAIANGIKMMAEAAYRMEELDLNAYQDIVALIKMYGLERELPSIDRLLGTVRHDKKATGTDGIYIVKIKAVGNCFVQKMTFEEFDKYMCR